jgi:amidophosphoribosyltransferase
MSGIIGVFNKKGNCILDLFLGAFYLQHRAQDYCGLAYKSEEKLEIQTHKGLLRQQFHSEELSKMNGNFGIGCVASDRQPVVEYSKSGGMILTFDGNIVNHEALIKKMLASGITFSGFKSPNEVSNAVLISKMISREENFISGIKKLFQEIIGDFAIVVLKNEGIYAARGHGRKPLILGQKNGSYAVSSESNSFINTDFKIVRDVEPGEIVLINKKGISSLKKFELSNKRFGTFEWIYTAHPGSIIDRRSVVQIRKNIGKCLAKRYGHVVRRLNLVSPIPNSGRWHAIGLAQEAKLPYEEVFLRYDYSDRSFTPGEQKTRDFEAKVKLIPLSSTIKGKRIGIVDDSIVRGTQMLNRVLKLKELGAKEVHAFIACPPLMAACPYGKTTKKNEDCIARQMSLEKLRKKLKLDSLNYATIEDLEKAIQIPREKLCLECWMR